jgi:pilus assembly protein CpaC
MSDRILASILASKILTMTLLLAAAPLAAQTIAALPVSAAVNAGIPHGAEAIQSSRATERMHILVGQSTVLHNACAMRRVFVGNPAVLQTYNPSADEVVVTAKAAGVSSLVLWDTRGIETLYTVSADVDPEGLVEAIESAWPRHMIRVEAEGDRITLNGIVPTQEMAEAAAKMAALYAKTVVNSLRVQPVHGKQVQLKLRIAEVDRTRLEQLAINLARTSGSNLFSTSTQQAASTITQTAATNGGSTVTVSDPLNLFFFNGAHNIGVTVKDLESKNIMQILAEPNLTTMSGQPARFLSGGEFPFPVVQPGGAGSAPVISVTFKPYGVKVEFTPTVNDDGTIHLKISPEVSSLDYSNAISISGFTVPALSTRRTETEVELKNGQSYAVSGLLDRQVTDSLSKVPGIAQVPILGQIFRSKNLNHSVSELVIVVTATVVDPLENAADKPVEEPAMPVPFLNKPKFDDGLEPSKKMEANPKQP